MVEILVLGDADAIAIDSSGNVTITQNLTVQGTTTTQDSQTLTVSANLIEVKWINWSK